MSSVGIVDIISNVQQQVGTGLPISFGKKARSTNVSPPQVWIYPTGERFSGPQGPGASTNARTLHTREVDLEVHCRRAGDDHRLSARDVRRELQARRG